MQKKTKKPLNKYLQLSSAGLQMGISIYLGAYLGKKLDAHYQFEKPAFTIGLILIGFLLSMYSLLQKLKKLDQ
ncbi:MAG: AtpZ/AtpI family protein [Flavobacteriaceae bacterium]|nr:AtpZ/AtpI family protein [Flavobacteriaceae bacterium]